MQSKFKKGDLITFIESEEGRYTQTSKGRVMDVHVKKDKRDKKDKIKQYFYDVQVEGILIENVPEDHIEFALSDSQKQVDEILRQKEKDKEYKDSDIRVGGSRKEKQAYKDLITGNDLEAIEKDHALAKSLIRKDKVYPKLIIANEIDKGVSGGTAFLKQKLRDACGSFPPDSKDKRKYYVEFISYVVSVLNPVVSVDEFKKALQTIEDNIIPQAIIILRPEFKPEIEQQRQEADELQLKHEALQGKTQELNKYFRDKYKEYYWSNRDNVLKQIEEDSEDKKKHEEFKVAYDLLDKINDYSHTKILPIESTFLESMGFKINSYIRVKILTEIFGKRFGEFIDTDARQYWEKAYGYDGMTEEQAKEKIEKGLYGKRERLDQINHFVQFFSHEDLSYKQKLEEFEREDSKSRKIAHWGFYKSFFGVKKPAYLYYRDVKDNPEWLDIFIKRTLEEVVGNKISIENTIKEIEAKYKPKDNDYSWAEKGHKGNSGERTDLVANSGVPLSYIKRDGGVKVTSADLDTDEKIKWFYPNILGITRFEYGNYLPDKERVQHARHFACALIDMAEMMNWDVKALTGLGNLGIKFASSGKGKASAHYESDRTAINLTRSAGDGTVCHEMGHYIDNMIAVHFKVPHPTTYKRFSADASYTQVMGGGDNVNNKEIQTAFNNVMMFIRKGTINITGEYANKIDELNEIHKAYINEKTLKVEIEKTNKKPRYTYDFPETIEEWITKENTKGTRSYLNLNNFEGRNSGKAYLGAVVNYYKLSKYEFTLTLPHNTTAVYQYSKNMGSEYWVYAWELFTRAFECYMYDKLAKLNRCNNYLVSGNYFERSEGVYAQGIEREILFILIDSLILTIKQEMKIPDFKAFREERADEYISINVKKEEENEELIVDNETKEVIESTDPKAEEETSIQQKLINLRDKLQAGLVEKKFRSGGQVFDKLTEYVN